MLTRLKNLLSVLCLFLLLVSCNKNKVEDKQLLRAEILISFLPTVVIRFCNPFLPMPFPSPNRLLLAEATDKKYLPLLACDSLLNEAFITMVTV